MKPELHVSSVWDSSMTTQTGVKAHKCFMWSQIQTCIQCVSKWLAKRGIDWLVLNHAFDWLLIDVLLHTSRKHCNNLRMAPMFFTDAGLRYDGFPSFLCAARRETHASTQDACTFLSSTTKACKYVLWFLYVSLHQISLERQPNWIGVEGKE